MTALLNERMGSSEKWGSHLFVLLSGTKAWKNGIAAVRVGTGKVVPGALESDLFVIGKFAESIDATLADTPVNVDMGNEIAIEWWANSLTNPVAITDLCNLCYILDDQTVSIAPNGGSVAGRVWGVETVRGVAVQRIGTIGAGGSGTVLSENTLNAFASNNINAPAVGGVYDVPTTSAASTITLPAATAEGTVLYFVADGIKNAHTVQYRDATGPVNVTAALTASKRHMVIATFLNGLWSANASVSP